MPQTSSCFVKQPQDLPIQKVKRGCGDLRKQHHFPKCFSTEVLPVLLQAEVLTDEVFLCCYQGHQRWSNIYVILGRLKHLQRHLAGFDQSILCL